MGMTVSLCRLSPGELASAQAAGAVPEDIGGQNKLDDGTDRWCFLDKSWDGILFLLTGAGLSKNDNCHPLRDVYLTGDLLGADVVDGSVLEPTGVVEMSSALAGVSDDELRARFDPVRMVELDVYPRAIWDNPSELEEVLLPCARNLREFYANAARRGDAMISYLSA